MTSVPHDSTEQHRDCSLRIQRAGQGRPLLYLHGGSGGGQWHPFLEAMARSRTVIAPEHPGFGDSPTPNWLQTPRDWAQFYVECLDRWNVDELDVVGSSLGGWIALEMALLGAPVRALVLSAPAGIVAPGCLVSDVGSWSRNEAHYSLYWDKARAPALRDTRNDSNRHTMQSIRRNTGMRSVQLEASLGRIANPTLIIWGQHDELTRPENGSFLVERLKLSKLILIDRCGHLPLQERPEIAFAAVDSFLAGIDMAAPSRPKKIAGKGVHDESLCL